MILEFINQYGYMILYAAQRHEILYAPFCAHDGSRAPIPSPTPSRAVFAFRHGTVNADRIMSLRAAWDG